MTLSERLRLAAAMVGWSHADLLAFVRAQSQPGGAFTLAAPLPDPVGVELEANREGAHVEVRVLAAPALDSANDDGVFFARAIARRAQMLRDVVAAVLERPGIQAAELADAHGVHPEVVERIVRGRRVRVGAEEVALETLVDFDGEVATTRTEPTLMAAIEPCTQHHGMGDASVYEWPNNVLSPRTRVLEGGVIVRDGAGEVARYRPAERARCTRLADEAAAALAGITVGLRSESDDPFLPFFCTAAPDSGGPPATLDEAWVRALFGGTISPHDPVRVHSFADSSPFFLEATGGDPERESRFRSLLAFFEQHELTRPIAIEIGFYEYAPAPAIAAADRPAGFECRGSCLPRLIVAFTDAGSVVGVLGHAVWT